MQWGGQREGDSTDDHATGVNPSSPKLIDKKLPDEDRGHLSERQQAEVDEHVAGQVLHIH